MKRYTDRARREYDWLPDVINFTKSMDEMGVHYRHNPHEDVMVVRDSESGIWWVTYRDEFHEDSPNFTSAFVKAAEFAATLGPKPEAG